MGFYVSETAFKIEKIKSVGHTEFSMKLTTLLCV